MRVAFLGSPPFATPVFARVAEGSHELVALVTRPERPRGRGRKVEASEMVALARARGIPVLQPETARDPAFQAELRALRPDVLLVASFGQILDQAMLELAPRGAFNVHASLLPRHRGAAPIQAAILAGDERTGISIQRIVLALDEGDVILARELPIAADETAGVLFERLAELGAEAAVEALALVAAGEERYRPQDPAQATYARKLKKDDGRIHWERPAARIERHVRAMTPWPGARTRLSDGKELGVARARVVGEAQLAAEERARLAQAVPGELLATEGSCRVATGEGVLELVEVTPAGKRAMPAADWLRGARLEPGARLGEPA